MTQSIASSTFAVSDVSPATAPLPEMPYHEAVARLLCSSVESCSRYHGQLVKNVVSHPLIAALHGAFTTHRPLVLSPDIIWLTITQGLALHINLNAESLRHQFVSHDSTMTISVQRDDFVKGSPENPWPEVFSAFSEKIRNHIGNAYDLIVADFSTTGPVERAASEVVLLDSMQSYFRFEFSTLCGIPSITLEGSVGDWRSLASRTEELARFDLDWWVDPLRPVLRQFVSAAEGEIDLEFWDSIYKFGGPHGSGTPEVSGWVSTLFPYLRLSPLEYTCNKTADAAPSRKRPSREAFPNTCSMTPVKWTVGVQPHQKNYDMEFIGGLIGVSQHPDSLALRPEIGWAVRERNASSTNDHPRGDDPFCLL